MKVFLKVLMWIAIIAIVVFVVLFISVRVSKEFNTIPELIDYLINEYNKGSSIVSDVVLPPVLLPRGPAL